MNYTVLCYCIYLPAAIMLTVWVAKTLLNNAKVFYLDMFHGQGEQAAAVNKLIQVGFYLVNLGFTFLRLRISTDMRYDEGAGHSVQNYMDSAQEMIEVLSIKLGGSVIILGVTLFINLIMILILRSASTPSRPVVRTANTPAVAA